MNNSSTVAMISLGCPKNLVNSEEMLALLQDAGYAFTDDLAKADAVIINTCAFIESAKTEAIEKILETASYREENPELKIIVSITESHDIGLRQAPVFKKLLESPSLMHAFLNEVNSTKTTGNSN